LIQTQAAVQTKIIITRSRRTKITFYSFQPVITIAINISNMTSSLHYRETPR
jgi:hypothetical protein